MNGRNWLKAGALLLALLTAAYCALLGDGAGQVVATVKSTSGEVLREERDAEGVWRTASVGDELFFGDALRTGADAHATAVLADGSALDLDPNTIVRFLDNAGAEKEPQFRVDTGLAMFESTGQEVSFATATGLVRVAPRSRVRVSHDAVGMHMEVSFGKASFIDETAAAHALQPGDELLLKLGERRATVAPKGKIKPGDDLAAQLLVGTARPGIDTELSFDGDAGDEDPEVTIGEVELVRTAQRGASGNAGGEGVSPGLTRADVTVRAGEYATIHHATKGATRVRVNFANHCDDGVGTLEVKGSRGPYKPAGTNTNAVIFAAKPGVTRYRVRCENQPKKIAVQGTVRVVRDAAVRRVPLRPPTNGVDLDGRRYTVLYQNRLPSVIARYSKVPSGARSRVVVQSGERMRTYEGEGNSVKIVSGQLEDGEHEMFLETLDGKIRSPKTTLRIAFDNAAPTASFDQRGMLERDASGRALVSGVVPQGARVSLEGQALTVDPSGRFSGEAVVDSGGAVSLRVEHPHAGLHYYVRQVAGESAVP